MDYKVEVICKNTCSNVGEGPHWEDRTKSLLYVDIYSGDVHRWNSMTNSHESRHLPLPNVSIIVPCKTGGYIVNQNNTICHFDWEKNSLKELHKVEEETFNDGKCDASGRFWNGTAYLLNKEKHPILYPEKAQSLYSLETDGTLVKRLDGISLSNGLAWSADNCTMFYIDSFSMEVSAFDFDITSGNMSNRRCVLTYDKDGLGDGMTIDTEDKLWIAMFGSGKIIRLDPETGKIINSVQLPGGVKNVTSCCFGGKNHDELYVTTSTWFEQESPQDSGSVYRVYNIGAKGFPACEYGT